MPKAWKAGEFWVDAEQQERQPLEHLEADRAEQRPGPQRRGWACAGWASSLKRMKNSSDVGGEAERRRRSAAAAGASSSPSPSQSRMSSAKPLTKPATATLSTSTTPMIARRDQVAELADHEVGLLALPACSNITISALAHRRQPAEAGVQQAEQADDQDEPGAALLEGVRRELALVGPEDAGEQRLERVDEGVLGVGVDLRDSCADDEEAERQDREERQEREVGDRAGLQVALDRRRSARPSAPRGRRTGAARPEPSVEPFLEGGHQAPPPQREVAARLPARSPRRGRRGGTPRPSKTHSKLGQLLERAVERLVGQVVGDGHVRVVGELQRHVERPAAYGAGELLAAARCPRRAVTNTTGETGRKVPVPRRWMRKAAQPPATSAGASSIPARSSSVDLGRRHQRDVGRDHGRGRVAERRCGSPGARSPRAPGMARATPIVGMPSTLAAAARDEADPLVDVAQGRLGDRARPARRRCWSTSVRWVWSSSSSRVRSRNGVTNSTTTSARSFLRSP